MILMMKTSISNNRISRLNERQMLLIYLQIHNEIPYNITTRYSLGSSSCFLGDNNTFACAGHFYGKNVSHIFILHLASFAVTQIR